MVVARCKERGFTLVELLVAGTLMGVFGLLFASAGSSFFQAMAALDLRTDNLASAEVATARLLADAAAASNVACAAPDRVAITIGQGAETLVEYRLQGTRLVRWALPPDADSLVAEPVQKLACASQGTGLVEVDADIGGPGEKVHVAMTVSETESTATPGTGGGQPSTGSKKGSKKKGSKKKGSKKKGSKKKGSKKKGGKKK